MKRSDLVLVGGGLANGLLAYRLAALRPDLSVLVIEDGAQAGGNHTWSFHATDLTAAESAWIEPFVVHRWPAYTVRFPGRVRSVGLGYRSVTSERFAAVLGSTLGGSLRCGTRVQAIAPTNVELASGESIEADAVLDGRGFRPSSALDLAYQLFLGREVLLEAPHGLDGPVLMDATVAQHEGYRFVYVLPFGPDRLLVEDTYYTERPHLDAPILRERLDAYVTAQGWRVRAVTREESGVLPITLGGDLQAFWREAKPGIAATGLRAALFHPTTGYSLPDAVRLADHLAHLPDLSGSALARAVRDWSLARWRSQGYYRLLNRMLFRAGPAAERFRILQRFYGLPEAAIARFYAGRLTSFDKLRLLSGRPPVPLLGAIRALASQRSRRVAA